MSACSLLNGPDTTGIINSQLTAVAARGDAAYLLALDAINSLTTVFNSGPVAKGIAWKPNPQYGTPIDKSREFVKPSPTPTVPPSTFTRPADPVAVAGMEGIEDVLADILDELKALIASMPEFEGVSVNDLYLTLYATYADKLTTQMNTVLAACPATSVLCTILGEWLSEGAVGMPSAVEQALRDRAFVTEDRQAMQAQSEAQQDWLSRGFTLPGGALDAKLAEVAQKASDRKSALNRDILIEAAKWEQDTRKFAVEKTVQLEGMRRDFFIKVNELARTIAGEWQANHIKVQLAKVEVYKALMEGYSAAAGALQTMGAAAGTLLKAKIDEQAGRIELFKAKLQGQLGELEAGIKVFEAEHGLYKTEAEMERSRITTILEQDRLDLQRLQIDSSMDMKGQELEMTRLLETGKITAQAYSEIARTASTIAAGWTSALSMQASISTRASYDNSRNCNETYSYSS